MCDRCVQGQNHVETKPSRRWVHQLIAKVIIYLQRIILIYDLKNAEKRDYWKLNTI